MRIMFGVYVEWFAVGLERHKGWANDLLIVAARCVHVRRENRFEVIARNINSYNAN